MLVPWEKNYDQRRQPIKRQRHYFANKGLSSQSYGFSSGHVYMWELDHKEIWIIRIDVFELWCWRRLLRVPWTARSPTSQPKRKSVLSIHWNSQLHAEAETPILWPPDVKNWLIGKDPGTVKDWRREEKGKTEDEMVGWHHRLNGHEFEQAPGVGDGQRSLACCSPRGHKESDMNRRLEFIYPCSKYLSTSSPSAMLS